MMRKVVWIALIAAFTAAGASAVRSAEPARADGLAVKVEIRASAKTDPTGAEAESKKATPDKAEGAGAKGTAKPPAKAAAKGPEPAPKKPQPQRLPPAPGRDTGWLGVRMGAVPEGLAVHLRLEKDAGVIVRNVVVGSPADKAGLERYDIILRVNGKPVDLGSLAGKIRAKKPGKEAALDVIHNGQKNKVQVVLGKPVPLADAKLKYEEEPETIWQDRMKWQGGLLRKGPKGWRWLPGTGPFADLDELLKAMPKLGDWRMELEFDGGDGIASWTLKRTTDGKTIEVQRHKDGGITVRRSETDKDGATRRLSKTYKNAEALRKADPEAFDIYRDMKGPGVRVWTWPPFQFDQKRWQQFYERMRQDAEGHQKQWKKELERQREDARKRAEEWKKKLESTLKDIPKPLSPRELNEMWQRMFGPGAWGIARSLREFKVDADGRIEVRIRDGDDDLTLKFKNDKELKAKRPKLYEQYQKLLKGAK